MSSKPKKGVVSASDVVRQIRPGVYERRDGSGYLPEQLIKPGEIMKHRRKELHMSMQELGDAIGVSKSTISRYESGEIEKLPVSYITPIAEALKVDPLYLLGAEDKYGENRINTATSHNIFLDFSNFVAKVLPRTK